MKNHLIRSGIIVLALLLGPFALLWAKSHGPDKDGDGWPDSYEQKMGTDSKNEESQPSATEDPDMDGLTNLEEREVGTDPTDPDSDNDGLSDSQEVFVQHTDPSSSDTDKDGSNDLNEIMDGTDPRRPDSDGDGWLDGAEKTAGSDPLNASSVPKSS